MIETIVASVTMENSVFILWTMLYSGLAFMVCVLGWRLVQDNRRKNKLLSQALQALCLTRDYVSVNLPPIPGWSWYDAGKAIEKEIPEDNWAYQFRCRCKPVQPKVYANLHYPVTGSVPEKPTPPPPPPGRTMTEGGKQVRNEERFMCDGM